MIRQLIKFIWLFPLCVQAYQDQSIFRSGVWLKLGVTEESVYKIDHNFLQAAGINTDLIDPRKIRLFGNGGEMLPQANSDFYPLNPLENAIQVVGEEDGRFDPGDYILFVGKDPDTYYYDDFKKAIFYQNNDYSDTSFYYLNFDQEEGLRVSSKANIAGTFPEITKFDDYQVHEIDLVNILQQPNTRLAGSGREWYGELFFNDLDKDFTFTFPGLLLDSKVQVVTSNLAASFATSRFQISINDVLQLEQIIQPIPDARYGIKGREKTDTIKTNGTVVDLSSGEVKVTVTYLPGNVGTPLGYLNFLVVNVERALTRYDGQTFFRSLESLNHPVSTYLISNITGNELIWDATDPVQPLLQEFETNGNTISFSSASSQFREFVMFNPLEEFPEPVLYGPVPNQDLLGVAVPDLVIVTHPDLISEALRLADFRTSHDQLSVEVFTTNQVFNEFSSGTSDPSGIRNFMRHLYQKQPGKLKYLLLFGRTTYDFKNRTEGIRNLVPTYVSRNALDPLRTYSSDDYFAFLEDNEGVWEESITGDETMDIGVGRLPVKNIKEAQAVVGKLVHYSSNSKTLGSWRNNIYFIADDGDGNIHQRQADQMASFVDTTASDFNPLKIYLDAFPQFVRPGREESPEAIEALESSVENGGLIINFTGHGGEVGWTDENILRIPMIEQWNNFDKLPLFVTATCEFGRHDDPFQISGGELTVLNPKGGGIALVTTARPVFSSTNFNLNIAFYNAVFQRDGNNQPLRLGDIFRLTKNNSLSGPLNRNFSLLGDPSLNLAFPQYRVRINELNGTPFVAGADTLKAMQQVILTGEIVDQTNNPISSFNGTLQTILFDKPRQLKTLGNENPQFIYTDRINALFRGKSSVSGGKFSLDFIIPKDIDFRVDHGKISMYAMDTATNLDANGAEIEILIGSTYDNPAQDKTPPLIEAYLESPDFKNGDVVNSNTLLFVHLSDESGINISKAGIGHEITAKVNNQLFILNDYFESELDDSGSGRIVFPLENLTPGRQSLTIKAWDVFNNPSENTIEFVVSDEPILTIRSIKNYPNPFYESTTFSFEHDRPGDNLQVDLQIINRNGQIIRNDSWQLFNVESKVDDLSWDGTNNFSEKVDRGLYFYKIMVRSLKDGAKNQMFNRLIIIN